MTTRLRSSLDRGSTAYGMWVTLENASITEIAGSMGLDWVCVDFEHGHLGYRDLMEHCRAAARFGTAVLVRVAAVEPDQIKRALDIGADGLLLPLIRKPEEVRRAVEFAKYPPIGVRGVGGERAAHWGINGAEYLTVANDRIMVFPLIETVEAVENLDGILAEPGIEGIYLGPADLSASAGHLGQWEGPGVADMILDTVRRAAERGLPAGVNAVSTKDAVQRRDQGFRLVGLGSDMGLMIREVNSLLSDVAGRTAAHNWF